MQQMLVVDDEPNICKCLDQFFSKRAFSVTCAFSGEEGLMKLKENRFDVVLVDIMLPGIHGIEVLRQAKQLYPTCRVIMMTGLEHDELRDKARHAGANAYVTKPFDFTDATWSKVLPYPLRAPV